MIRPIRFDGDRFGFKYIQDATTAPFCNAFKVEDAKLIVTSVNYLEELLKACRTAADLHHNLNDNCCEDNLCGYCSLLAKVEGSL